MTTLQTAQEHIEQMQLILLQLAGYEGQRTDVINNGKRFGNSPHEISGILQNIADVEKDLIKQYRKHSQDQFRLIREFEIRNSEPIDFKRTTGAIFSHTSHNSEVAKDMEQL